MVIMGGGPEVPTKDMNNQKEVVLCTISWPESDLKKAIDGLEEEFKDIEVKFYQQKQGKKLEVPEGT